jgi:hypothetical protein
MNIGRLLDREHDGTRDCLGRQRAVPMRSSGKRLTKCANVAAAAAPARV